MALAQGVLFCMGVATSVPSMLKDDGLSNGKETVCAASFYRDGLHGETKSCHERNYKCRILQKHDSASLVTIENSDEAKHDNAR